MIVDEIYFAEDVTIGLGWFEEKAESIVGSIAPGYGTVIGGSIGYIVLTQEIKINGNLITNNTTEQFVVYNRVKWIEMIEKYKRLHIE